MARLQVVSPSIGLQTPLPRLVGDKTAKPMLDKLGLRTGDDLLRHYPRRYVHRGELTNLADLRVGEEVTVLAKVARTHTFPPRGEKKVARLEVMVTDGTGTLKLTFFSKSVQGWLAQKFEGRLGLFSGTVDEFRNQNKDRAFALLSTSVDSDKVHVICAVSPSLTGRVKAPEVMKSLGLKGGGRPDFAQGGGVAAADVDALRRRAFEMVKGMLEGQGAA